MISTSQRHEVLVGDALQNRDKVDQGKAALLDNVVTNHAVVGKRHGEAAQESGPSYVSARMRGG